MMIRPYNIVAGCIRKFMIVLFLLSFTAGQILPAQIAFAQTASVLNLPMPGAMVGVSPSYVPISIKGIKVFPDNPFRFEFILDPGNSNLDQDRLNEETKLLVKYFLTALTIPDGDQWVNLSPYENDRIVPNEFGATEMGRDLLAQDYLLKQLTASLIYPEHELGKKFWENVYKKAYEKYGDVDIPVSTFNKVWVMPDRAKVYQHGNSAIIAESRLKVMLEEDYLAFLKNSSSEAKGKLVPESSRDNSFGSEVVREIVLPAIEKEVNEGRNFAKLRQIYHSMVMAAWYKRKLKDGILGKMYVGTNKVAGVDVEDKQIKQKIYEQYLAAYKKGVYNYIKEEFDEHAKETIPRKYFSGGVVAAELDRRLQVEPLNDQSFNREASRLNDSLTAVVVAAPVDAKGSLLADVAGLTGDQQRQGTSDKAQLSNAQLDVRVFENEVTSALKNPETRPGKIEEIRRSVQEKIRESYASTGETEGALGYELGRLAGAAFDSIIERYDQLKDDPVQQEAYLKEAKISFSYTVDPQTGRFQAELSNTGAGISQEILFRLQGQRTDLNNTVGYDTYQVIQSLVGGAMSYNQWYEISVVSKTKGARNAVRYTTGPAGQATVNDYYSSMDTGAVITFTGRSLSREKVQGTSDKSQLSDKQNKNVQFDVPVFDQIVPASLINTDTRQERFAEIRRAVQDKVREAYASTGETRGALGYELGRLAGVAFDSIIERYDYLNSDPVKQEAFLKEAKISLSYTIDQQTGQFKAVLSDTGAGISREVLNRMSGNFQEPVQTRFFGENSYFIIQGLLGGAKYYNQWDEIAVVSRTPNASTAYRFTTGLAGRASVNDYFSEMESGTEITITGRALRDNAMLSQLPKDRGVNDLLEGSLKKPHNNKQVFNERVVRSAVYANVPRVAFSFKEFMDQALHNPKWGYYTSGRVKFGDDQKDPGDFVTYPDLMSPFFGQLVAQQAYKMWEGMKKAGTLTDEESFDAIEFGAGNAVLAYDFLEYVRNQSLKDPSWQEFAKQVRYRIYERSPALRRLQEEKLKPFAEMVVVIDGDARTPLEAIAPKSVKGLVLSNEVPDIFGSHKVIFDALQGVEAAFVLPAIDKNFIDKLRTNGVSETLLSLIIEQSASAHQELNLSDDNFYLTPETFKALMDTISDFAKDVYESYVKSIQFSEIYIPAGFVPEIVQHIRDNKAEYAAALTGPRNEIVHYINVDGENFIAGVGQILKSGYVITIDYGDSLSGLLDKALSGQSGNFRVYQAGVENGTRNPYQAVTLQDLTFDQDFTAFARAGEKNGLKVVHFGSQGDLTRGTQMEWGVTLRSFELTQLRNYLIWDRNKMSNSVSEFFSGHKFKMLVQQQEGTDAQYNAFQGLDGFSLSRASGSQNEGALRSLEKSLDISDNIEVSGLTDEAQTERPEDLGGIDMNANALDLQTEGQEIKLDMPFNPAQWQNIKLDGFTPIILQINTTNLPLFIGAGEPANDMRLSSMT